MKSSASLCFAEVVFVFDLSVERLHNSLFLCLELN